MADEELIRDLFEQPEEDSITVHGCLAHAIGQLNFATYNAQGDMDRIARGQLAMAWLMLADRVPDDRDLLPYTPRDDS
jgi:hypothetical protein